MLLICKQCRCVEQRLEYITFHVQKHIAPLAVCSGSALVHDGLLGVLAFVRLAYWKKHHRKYCLCGCPWHIRHSGLCWTSEAHQVPAQISGTWFCSYTLVLPWGSLLWGSTGPSRNVHLRGAHCVVKFTECSPERVALHMSGIILWECAEASMATAGVLTRGRWWSLCVWHRCVQTSWAPECWRLWVALS